MFCDPAYRRVDEAHGRAEAARRAESYRTRMYDAGLPHHHRRGGGLDSDVWLNCQECVSSYLDECWVSDTMWRALDLAHAGKCGDAVRVAEVAVALVEKWGTQGRWLPVLDALRELVEAVRHGG